MKTHRATGSVFISHSHKDKDLVRDIARRLRTVGLEPFIDIDDLPTGAHWKKILLERLRDADAVLVLLTPAALESPWSVTEVGMAEGFDKVILPVTAGLEPQRLPAPLQSYQVVPFDELDGAISKLAQKLAETSDD